MSDTNPTHEAEAERKELCSQIADMALQLAAKDAEIARLREDQQDWRKGVELIASALGEKNPPDLSCARLSEVALELRAALAAAEQKQKDLVDALHEAENALDDCYDIQQLDDREGVQALALNHIRAILAKPEGQR